MRLKSLDPDTEAAEKLHGMVKTVYTRSASQLRGARGNRQGG
jgi:hypothetical protein